MYQCTALVLCKQVLTNIHKDTPSSNLLYWNVYLKFMMRMRPI